MWIEITPFDALFFRDSKPFTAGEQTEASNSFPPFSLPFVGAIRSQMLRSLLDRLGIGIKDYKEAALNKEGKRSRTAGEVIDRLGDHISPHPLAFNGPFPALREGRSLKAGSGVLKGPEVFFPAPMDLLREEHDPKMTCYRLKPAEFYPWKVMESSPPGLWLLPSSSAGGMEAVEAGYLKGSHLEEYLLDKELDGSEPLLTEPLGQPEPRTGIALTDKGSVKTGLLYTIQFVRLLPGISFLMKVESSRPGEDLRPLFPDRGVLKLGGEGKMASFELMESQEKKASLPAVIREDSEENMNLRDALIEKLGRTQSLRFKMYLLSPAVFEKGWVPDGIDRESLCGELGGIRVRMVGATVGKPQHVSGWDLMRQQPRDLLRVAPAGSVYFFEAEDRARRWTREELSSLVGALHFRSMMKANGVSALCCAAGEVEECSFVSFCRAAGFGLAALGLW